MSSNILPWVDLLPNGSQFSLRRDEIMGAMRNAHALERQAQRLLETSEQLKSEAYIQSCVLEGQACEWFGADVVAAAKRQAGW